MGDIQKYKHIIWDFNGTILDDAWLCVDVLGSLLSKRKMPPVSMQQYQKDFDFPVIDYYRKIGFDFEKESFDSVAAEYIAGYESRIHQCALQNGVLETLKKLRHAGQAQHVLSAAHQGSLEVALKKLGLRKYFEKIAGLADYYAHSKIDIGKSLLEELKVKGSEVLMIGDTTHDFEVACQTGFDCVLIPSGHQNKKRLIACGAAVCDSLDQLF
ncbi:MAG: HAD family hydrolase [Anaerohalosphaeraceae bacterium]|nr:HAD family hydrolase [Anaerohalosphaeraceae bacterium]